MRQTILILLIIGVTTFPLIDQLGYNNPNRKFWQSQDDNLEDIRFNVPYEFINNFARTHYPVFNKALENVPINKTIDLSGQLAGLNVNITLDRLVYLHQNYSKDYVIKPLQPNNGNPRFQQNVVALDLALDFSFYLPISGEHHGNFTTVNFGQFINVELEDFNATHFKPKVTLDYCNATDVNVIFNYLVFDGIWQIARNVGLENAINIVRNLVQSQIDGLDLAVEKHYAQSMFGIDASVDISQITSLNEPETDGALQLKLKTDFKVDGKSNNMPFHPKISEVVQPNKRSTLDFILSSTIFNNIAWAFVNSSDPSIQEIVVDQITLDKNNVKLIDMVTDDIRIVFGHLWDTVKYRSKNFYVKLRANKDNNYKNIISTNSGRQLALQYPVADLFIDLDDSHYRNRKIEFKDCAKCEKAGTLKLKAYIEVIPSVTTDAKLLVNKPYIKIVDVEAEDVNFQFDKKSFIEQITNLGESFMISTEVAYDLNQVSFKGFVLGQMAPRFDSLGEMIHFGVEQD